MMIITKADIIKNGIWLTFLPLLVLELVLLAIGIFLTVKAYVRTKS